MRRTLLAILAALTVLGLAGCSSGGDGSPAASASTRSPAPPGTARTAVPAPVDPPTPAELAVATTQARRTDLDIAPGSLARVVAPRDGTRGHALWEFRARGLRLFMILTPAGKGVAWAGTATRLRFIDRSAGAAVAPSTLALAGRASPEVASVRIVTRSGERHPAVLGAGGWLYVTDDLPLRDESNGRIPISVEALDATGKVLRTVSLV